MHTPSPIKALRAVCCGAIVLVIALLLDACGQDRSGEQPFAPTVRTLGAYVESPFVTLTGEVVASPNSTLRARGFRVWNSERSYDLSVETDADLFSLRTDTVTEGTYRVAAYARNGVGVSYGDTLSFEID